MRPKTCIQRRTRVVDRVTRLKPPKGEDNGPSARDAAETWYGHTWTTRANSVSASFHTMYPSSTAAPDASRTRDRWVKTTTTNQDSAECAKESPPARREPEEKELPQDSQRYEPRTTRQPEQKHNYSTARTWQPETKPPQGKKSYLAEREGAEVPGVAQTQHQLRRKQATPDQKQKRTGSISLSLLGSETN